MDLYARQLEIEADYSTAALVAGQRSVIQAFEQGRASDLGQGTIMLAKAFEYAHAAFEAYLNPVKKTGGVGGKYRALLKIGDSEAIVMAGLREIINRCASVEQVTMQGMLKYIGRIVESEAMLACMTQVSPEYTDRTVQYLDSVGTKSVSHRYRTFTKGASKLKLDWQAWTQDELVGVARVLCTILYESTGLFKWMPNPMGAYILEPSDELSKHFNEVQSSARAIVKYPPMLVKPLDWVDQWTGGYLTDWFRGHAPMCGIRYIKPQHRSWILEGLASDNASIVREAMNKSQSVAYRVNTDVLSILRKATAMRVGILGLPSFQETPKPNFPFQEGWVKENATEDDLDLFGIWKSRMARWYTDEVKRKGKHMGILGRIQELVKYADESELYFPTFIDWRGRLYFRSNLNPQSSDAVKGCIEFAEGKVLGERGLFWLKVHVANSCGYDKHTPEIKAKWCDDNWSMISDFINNPLDVDAPEPDTAFTLLQSGLALQEALSLPEPTAYICHVPVAMDATCSGLQHLSALTRDPVGALYTNLINNNDDQKSDIYMQVGKTATDNLHQYISDEDRLITAFWELNPITRNMAKKPVMTHVYSATLLNAIQEVAIGLSESGAKPITSPDGTVLYSLSKLSVCVGKSLKAAVVATVPMADNFMRYLQKVVRADKAQCLRWVNPVGVPVVNWAEGTVIKRVNIRSMGVEKIVFKQSDGKYNTRIAANSIVPNFVHSNDGGHLCMTVAAFDGDILPIHDSFATHPSEVDGMHAELRTQFIKLYTEFSIESMLEFNDVDLEELPIPSVGLLDLNVIHDTPFMFS